MKLESLRKSWSSLKPANKHKLLLLSFVGVGVSIAVFSHLIDKKQEPTVSIGPAASQAISIDNKLLERTMTSEAANNKQEITELRKKLDELSKPGATGPATPASANPASTGHDAMPGQAKNGQAHVMPADPASSLLKTNAKPQPKQAALPPIPKQGSVQSSPIKIPPPPPMAGSQGSMTAGNGSAGAQAPKRTMDSSIGDIEMISGPKSSVKDDTQADKDKKKAESLYLPTGSFMEATLLSGLYAPTTSGARGNPVPVLIRVKAPSQLPNLVKANLKGCFIIAEGVGNLSDERAHLRLVNLSCIAKNGSAVIDQKIKGYVADDDGFIGLKGRVVARLGSTIARTLVAGFFGGFGDAMKSSTQTSTASALGLVSSSPLTNINQMAIAGAGQGLSDATKQLQTFYLELAKQSVPVIEILPRKKVTMVISEGVKLDVKPL